MIDPFEEWARAQAAAGPRYWRRRAVSTRLRFGNRRERRAIMRRLTVLPMLWIRLR